MWDKAIWKNSGTLKSVPYCYKNQQLCDEAVYLHALEFVPEYCKTQNMCYKAIDTDPSIIQSKSECYKTQEMCHKAVTR